MSPILLRICLLPIGQVCDGDIEIFEILDVLNFRHERFALEFVTLLTSRELAPLSV